MTPIDLGAAAELLRRAEALLQRTGGHELWGRVTTALRAACGEVEARRCEAEDLAEFGRARREEAIHLRGEVERLRAEQAEISGRLGIKGRRELYP